MKIYIPYYENCSWHTAILNSLECNLYKRKSGGYTIFAYNNTVAYQCKNYGNANVYKLDVETIKWKNRKDN